MTDLSTLPLADVGPNSIIVVRADEPNREAILHGLRDLIPNTTRILVMRRDTELMLVDEETMNDAGWFRHDGRPLAGGQG